MYASLWKVELPMPRLAYYLLSSENPPIDVQREAFGGAFDREFVDTEVSFETRARDRTGFANLLINIQEGDTLCLYHIDRVGRDVLDVQAMVRRLLNLGVTIDVIGVGPIGRGVGESVATLLAQVAELERNKNKGRCDAGRARAREALKVTGQTHRGKAGLGRPMAADPAEVAAWREANHATLVETGKKFGVNSATVRRYLRAV